MRARAGSRAASSRTCDAAAWNRRRRGPFLVSLSDGDPARCPEGRQESRRAYLHLPQGKSFESLRQLRERVGIPLPPRHDLPARQRVSRFLSPIQGLEDHPELQISREVIGRSPQELAQLDGGGLGLSLSFQLQRQRVAGKGVVGRRGDELAKLLGAVHGAL